MGFGSTLGSIAGGLGSHFLPIPGIDGSALGGYLGSMLPFKNGGRIPSHKIMGYARGGEVAPSNVYQRGGKVRKARKNKSKK